jgi:putative aminopeptidase FrvX
MHHQTAPSHLLTSFLSCHSPPGEEWREIEGVVRREMEAAGVPVERDDAGSLTARLPGDGPRVMVCAHMDEIGMVVNRVEADGRLRVENCGGAWPWKYGEGPVDLLGRELVRGVLSVGSVHTNTGVVHELKASRALTWDLVSVFTGRSAAELAEKGVRVGTRAVVARERKQPQLLGDYVASFALDDRMGLVALIAGLREMANRSHAADLYFVATTGEEAGMLGAARAAQRIRPEVCVALDTSPVAAGTPLVVDARPVIWYRGAVYNDKRECDRLYELAESLGMGAQACLYSAAASDAGKVKQLGLTGRSVCFGFARDNSHGYEIAHAGSLENVTRLLVEYLPTL